MDRKATAGPLVYEDFTPSHKWVQEDGFDTLIVDLPEFKKEQIKVQFEFAKLSVSGERPLGNNRWSRFRKELQVPKYSEQFLTKLENGRLHVKILPKAPKPMQDLVNVIVAVVLLVAIAVYLISKN